MQSGPAPEKTSNLPKEHHSLGARIVDALKPHHKHQHKEEDKKEAISEVAPKKHHHHDKKGPDHKEKKHHHHRHHHHRQEEATMPSQAVVNVPDVSSIDIKPQTLLPELEPLTSSIASEESKIVKAMATKDPSPIAIPQTTNCEKCTTPPVKKATWSEWAQDNIPGVHLVAPLFALHRQAGQDWVKDVEKVFSGVSKLEKKAEEAVSDYKGKLRPRSK